MSKSGMTFARMVEIGGPVVWELLGCRWGRLVGEGDGRDVPCPEEATGVLVLHWEGHAVPVKLCEPHYQRMLALTTPHGEDRDL